MLGSRRADAAEAVRARRGQRFAERLDDLARKTGCALMRTATVSKPGGDDIGNNSCRGRTSVSGPGQNRSVSRCDQFA